MMMGKVEREGNVIIWDKTGAELTEPSSYQRDKLSKLWACLVRHQPLDMKSENRQILSTPKAKVTWPFQEGGFWCRALAGQFAGLKICCGYTHYDVAGFPNDLFWFIRTFTDVKIQPSRKSDPTISQRSTESPPKARRTSCLPKITPSWGLHITYHSLSWAGEPHPHSKQNPAVPIHLKDPCSFSASTSLSRKLIT